MDIFNLITTHLLTFGGGFVTGVLTKDVSKRFAEYRNAKREFAAAISLELDTMLSGRRPAGVSNFDAISCLQRAGDLYLNALFLKRRRFAVAWSRFKDQISWDEAHKEPEYGFTSFGYRNYLAAADHLKALRKEFTAK